jgi:purine-binding chemotaxis protein CheW
MSSTSTESPQHAAHGASSSFAASGGRPLEFLAFKLGEEEYGIDIQKVQELRGYDAVTRIANAPEFIKGVVIVLNIGGRVVGMVVDSVSDVITLTAQQIKPAPEMGSSLDTDYLIGLGTLEERMLILVDIDKLMSSEEMGLVEKIAA